MLRYALSGLVAMVGLGLVVAGSGACSSGDGGGGDCGGTTFSPEADCQSCMQKSCCSALDDCKQGTACSNVLSCLSQCASIDGACQKKCEAMDGAAAVGSLKACYTKSCANDDACTAGHVCDSGFILKDEDDCATCLGKFCCSEWSACASSNDCKACAGDATFDFCPTNDLWHAASDCRETKCSTDCLAGRVCDSGLQNTSQPSCGNCDGLNCCAEFEACAQDGDCFDCVTGEADGATCSTNQAYLAAGACEAAKCSNVCP